MKTITIRKDDGWVNLTSSLSLDSNIIYGALVNEINGTFWLHINNVEPLLTSISTNSVSMYNRNEFKFKPTETVWAYTQNECTIAVYEALIGEVNQV